MDTYDLADQVTFDLQVRNDAGVLVTPTTITLTVTDPAGAVSNVVPVSTGIGLYSGTVTPAVAGVWVYRWVTTGPGAGAEDGAFLVTAALTSTDPRAWTPTAQDVADLIPRLVPDVDGTETGSFSATTIPTAAAVQRLADRVAAIVAATVGPVPPELLPVASDVAAIGTAVRVARPLDAAEAERLQTEYDAALGRLQTAVRDAADGVVDGSGDLVADPLHSFPEALDLVSPGAERPYSWPGWPYL